MQPGDGQLFVRLQPEGPGTLVVKGDVLASIFVDGVQVVRETFNSGPRDYPSGNHTIHVELRAGGHPVDTIVVVRPRKRTEFDYSKHTVTPPQHEER